MRAFLVPLFALSVPIACSGKVASTGDDGGVPNDTSPAPTDAPTSESTATPETCASCVNATCPDIWAECGTDASCTAQIDCISKCGSADCEKKCQTDNPSALGDEVLACLRGPCKDSCTRTIGG